MKLSYRFTQAFQAISFSLLFCGLGNAAFASDVKAEQEFKKESQTTIQKPQPDSGGDCKGHHCCKGPHCGDHNSPHPHPDQKHDKK
ncbi:MAG: hypothetical protein RL368_2212 [Pseudomonadota bacterium]|jgi:hypothetical protein